PAATVGLMTGVGPAHARSALVVEEGIAVLALATAGLANALRVGDPATAPSVVPGTINLILVVDAPLRDEALLECVALAAEARTLACLEAGVASTVSGGAATGTGTDCIAIAAPPGERALADIDRLLPGLGAPVAVRIDAGSPSVGHSLAELNLRGRSGATVLAISRRGEAIVVPEAGERLQPGDVLALAGSHEAIETAKELLGPTPGAAATPA
ncbi:MAG: adenosylcobinamide amidohydrolase, partial [Gemmatimonadales bacterium]